MTGFDASKVVIREAGAADAGRLSLVADATFLETFAGMISGEALVAHCERAHAPDYLRQLLAAGAKAWLAELDAAPIGYALVNRPELDAAEPGDIELKKIYLLSRFHGSGIAGRLFEAALARGSRPRPPAAGSEAGQRAGHRFLQEAGLRTDRHASFRRWRNLL